MKHFLTTLARIQDKKGYSLTELAISTSIIAMLAVGGLAILQKKNDSDKVKDTLVKMAKIDTALKGFIRVKGYIPCPAVPATIESSTSFGKEAGVYNTTTKICSTGLTNETGVVPVRTLGLPDETAYDGWGRKFTYRSASSSGNATDFGYINFKGNIAIIDLKGTHKTNINEPPPNNDGAIYIIISHGANGKNIAYGKNTTTAPSQATGIEAKNTFHNRPLYIQNEKTTIFDDIVVFGTKAKLGRTRIMESPIKIQDTTCETAQSLVKDGRSTLDTYAASNSNAYVSRANTIFKSASILGNLCKNYKKGETINPTRVNGIKLWLDAADKSTLFTNNNCVAGGIPANDTSIGCWKDKSTNGNNATQEIVDSQPKFMTAIQGGKPVIRFDGTDDYMGLPNNIVANGNIPYTVFATVKASNITANPGILNLGNFGTNNQSLAFRFDSTGLITDSWWSADISTTPGSVTVSTPYIFSFTYSTTAGRVVYINGTSSATSPTIIRNGLNNNQGYVGKTNGSEYMTGDIDEILVYNATLSTLDRNKIEEYLANKWGIILTTSTQTCNSGMVFQQTATDPIGSCKCPAGTTYIEDLATPPNACYPNDTKTYWGNCATVTVSSSPTYITPPPPSNAGMMLWLDANDCITLTVVHDTTTSSVTEWRDKSGQGNHATPTATINRPLYITGAINGKPTIRFDGTNSQLVLPRMISDDFTITTIFKTSAGIVNATAMWDSASGIIDASVSGTVNDFGMGIQSTGRLLAGTGTPNVSAYYSNKYSNGIPHILSFTRKKSNGALALSVDGTTVSTATGGTQSLTSPTRITLGSLQTNTNYLNGDISEVIIYNYVLSNQQRDNVELYLATKWDIPRTPSDISASNLKLWLDAADAATVYTDTACTTPTSGPSAKVACWKDKSDNSNHAIQATDSLKPLYTLAVQNSKPAVKFDGTDDLLDNTSYASKLSLSTTASIFAVASAGSATSNKIIINNDFNFYIGVGPTTNYFNSYYGNNSAWGVTTDHGAAAAPNMSTTFHIITSIADGTNVSPFIDGTTLTARANTMAAFTNGYTIGARQTTNSQYWDGNIAEIIIYNTALSATQREYIERYLAAKWAITRP